MDIKPIDRTLYPENFILKLAQNYVPYDFTLRNTYLFFISLMNKLQ